LLDSERKPPYKKFREKVREGFGAEGIRHRSEIGEGEFVSVKEIAQLTFQNTQHISRLAKQLREKRSEVLKRKILYGDTESKGRKKGRKRGVLKRGENISISESKKSRRS